MKNKQIDYCRPVSGNYPPTKKELFRRFAGVACRVLIVAVELAVFVAAASLVMDWVIS